MIFEAQSQLNKQQQVEHGGAVRGTDAARVQVIMSLYCFIARNMCSNVQVESTVCHVVHGGECGHKQLSQPVHITCAALIMLVWLFSLCLAT